MNNNIVIFGNTISVNTLLIASIIVFILFLLFNGENFTNAKKCSDLPSGKCDKGSQLCEELSFCKPQKIGNTEDCNCQQRTPDDE